MKRASFFVLLLLLEPVSFSQNLVVNPGFETWETTTKPSGWNKAENCLPNSSFIISGNYSCQHSGGSTTRSDLAQTIAVIPGKTYSLSYFNKTIENTGSGARIWCDWKDATGKIIEDPLTKPLMQPTKFLKNDTWQQFTINITAPSEAATFYLEIRTYTKSIAYWDDFVFQEEMTTYNKEEKYSDIMIYPNPVCNYLIICNIQDMQHIDIHNITGKNIISIDLSGEDKVSIPVSGIPSGCYIIRIQAPAKVLIRKFIKN